MKPDIDDGTVTEALLRAQQAVNTRNPQAVDRLRGFAFLGDPALPAGFGK